MCFKITRRDTPIGDCLLASLFVHILNDNNIKAFIDNKIQHFKVLDCNYDYDQNAKVYEFNYENCKSSILQIAIQIFKKKYNIEKEIKLTRKFVPVNFTKDSHIPNYDVVMVTKSGFWAPVRNWPYFTELKQRLSELKITWFDLTENKIQNNDFLNYVHKSKVFVTLETGASHYASQFVNNQNSLVIQSGYCHNSFWNFYDYDVISHETQCQGCFITHKAQCFNGQKCMKNINVELVLNKILEKLNVKI